MLTIEEAIDVNLYGQELTDLKPLLNRFCKLDLKSTDVLFINFAISHICYF